MMDKACPTPEPFRAMVGNILFLTLLFFVAFISRYIFSPLMPVIRDELALTHGQAGSVFLFGFLSPKTPRIFGVIGIATNIVLYGILLFAEPEMAFPPPHEGSVRGSN